MNIKENLEKLEKEKYKNDLTTDVGCSLRLALSECGCRGNKEN